MEQFHGTTIVSARRGTHVALGGDGQVTLGNIVVKASARKVRRLYEDKILAGFRVPKTVIGNAESQTNRATAETADYVFARRTIKPKMERIVQQMNEFLIPLVLLPSNDNQTVALSMAYTTGQWTSDPTARAAAALLGALPSILFFLVFQRTLMRGVTMGSVK